MFLGSLQGLWIHDVNLSSALVVLFCPYKGFTIFMGKTDKSIVPPKPKTYFKPGGAKKSRPKLASSYPATELSRDSATPESRTLPFFPLKKNRVICLWKHFESNGDAQTSRPRQVHFGVVQGTQGPTALATTATGFLFEHPAPPTGIRPKEIQQSSVSRESRHHLLSGDRQAGVSYLYGRKIIHLRHLCFFI